MLTRRSLLTAPLALALAGCGRPPSPSGTSPTPGGSAAGPFKVGLITTGGLTDGGWNALAGQALERMKTELGADVSHQAAGAAVAEETLRSFGRDGYRLVFAHGTEFKDAARLAAEEHAETVFVVSSGDVKAANLASLRFDLGEASYLAGMAAAALSKTGKAGQIGGQPFPPVEQAFALFTRGGKAIREDFTAPITYVGNWEDANAAKEKALAMIRGGADVIFQNADAAGEGVFVAAEGAKERRVLVIGSNANQNALKPEIIAASAVLDVPKTFLSVARDVKAGTFTGDVFRQDLKSGNVYLAVNPAFESQIPPDVRRKMEQAEADIKAGRLKLVAA
ncbi:MAG TPA: BMP family protein [Armatimonadota bacterium]|nr:BMP family protein [Armatimonadota bacterium]